MHQSLVWVLGAIIPVWVCEEGGGRVPCNRHDSACEQNLNIHSQNISDPCFNDVVGGTHGIPQGLFAILKLVLRGKD